MVSAHALGEITRTGEVVQRLVPRATGGGASPVQVHAHRVELDGSSWILVGFDDSHERTSEAGERR